MHEIHEWVNSQLLDFGLSAHVAEWLDTVIILVIILLIALITNYILSNVFLQTFKKVAAKTKTDWDDIIIDRKVIHRVIRIVPAIIAYVLLPFAFPVGDASSIQLFLQKLCVVYIIAVSVQFVNALLNLVNDLYNRRQSGKSIKGFIQVLQMLIVFIGIILMVGELFNLAVGNIIAGLGASAAVLMLVFKDSILGFVAGVQLSTNDLLRTGDCVTMPKYGADGDVIDITLNAIKVRNFDNTIVSIPPYALVSDSFQNWRGMSESGGRRIKRSINIDMDSVRFCTPEMLDKFRKIEVLREYIDQKEEELKVYNEEHHIDADIVVNGRRQTNIGVFRAYIEQYLKHHPKISKNHTCMVRQLQPTEKGIPIELYTFVADVRWVYYENIQADIFDHLLAVISEFELDVFQNISGRDIRSLKNN